MHGDHVDAAAPEWARTAPINRQTALKILGGCCALLAGAPQLRPAGVRADHDGT